MSSVGESLTDIDAVVVLLSEMASVRLPLLDCVFASVGEADIVWSSVADMLEVRWSVTDSESERVPRVPETVPGSSAVCDQVGKVSD